MEQRDRLGPRGLALLLLVANDFGFAEDARLLLRNLGNFRFSSGSGPDSALVHWRQSRDSVSEAVETTAWVLAAHLQLHSGHPDIEPAVNWLLTQRQGMHWQHTKATAIVLSALTDYVLARDDFTASAQFSVFINGQKLTDIDIDILNTLSAQHTISVPSQWLDGTPLRVRIQRTGGESHRLYASLTGSFGRPGATSSPSTGELAVYRDVYILTPVPTLLRGYREQLVPLSPAQNLNQGDRIEHVLVISAASNLSHVLVSDPKSAGFESTLLLSGEPIVAREIHQDRSNVADPAQRYTGRTLPVFAGNFTQSTAFYLDQLQQGTWEIRYRLRAEASGVFQVLPPSIEAMYAPHLNGHGTSLRLTVGAEQD